MVTKKKAKAKPKAKATTKVGAKKKAKKTNCRPSFKISQAGHLLRVEGDSHSAIILGREAKKAKAKRKAKGCLNGGATTFKLSAKQKKNLPKALQKAIIDYHRKLGKRIIT